MGAIRWHGRQRSRSQYFVAALVAGWLAAAPAAAGTIGISGGKLIIGADPDTNVDLVGFGDGSLFTLSVATGAFQIVTPGCSIGSFGFECSGFDSLLVIGSDKDDVLDFQGAAVKAILAAGLGNDILFSGPAADTVVYGGGGDDLLFGDPANMLFGGPGDDTVFVSDPTFGFIPGTDLGDSNPSFDPLPNPTTPIPEPSTVLLLLTGLGATAVTRSRWQPRRARYC